MLNVFTSSHHFLLLVSRSVMSNSLRPHGTATHQASLSFTVSQSLLKRMSTESVMPSNHLILCHPLLLLPSIFPRIRVFSNESALCIRGPKYWSFTFSISPSKGRRPLRSKVKETHPASVPRASLAPTCQPLLGTLGLQLEASSLSNTSFLLSSLYLAKLSSSPVLGLDFLSRKPLLTPSSMPETSLLRTGQCTAQAFL